MSSLEEVVSILKPRRGDQTNLIPVKSKVEQDALINNAYSSNLINPKSSKPGRTLELSHPYYRVVSPKKAHAGDESNVTLYEYLHIPTVRMNRWLKLANERKENVMRRKISIGSPLRKLHTDDDSNQQFIKRQRSEVNVPQRAIPEPIHETPAAFRKDAWTPALSKPEVDSVVSHQQKDMQFQQTPSTAQMARPTESVHHQESTRTLTKAILSEEPCSVSQFLTGDDIPTQSLLTGGHKKVLSKTHEQVAAFFKDQTYPQRIRTGDICDLDTEEKPIEKNYKTLTKQLVKNGVLQSSSLQSAHIAVPLNNVSTFGDMQIIPSNRVTTLDARTINIGRLANSSNTFFILYPWRKGSWEAARALKGLHCLGIPESWHVLQYLTGSHSFMESPVQPSDRHCSFAENGFTMILTDSPVYTLDFFIKRQASPNVMVTLFYQLFARYRDLAFKRIVHYFLNPDTICISIRGDEVVVFPVLWDYSVDRAMFSDRKTQFFSTKHAESRVYTDEDNKPYDGFFADLVAMHALLSAHCPDTERCLALISDMLNKSGSGARVTPSFFTLLQTELDYDVQSVKDFITEQSINELAYSQ